MPVKKKKTRLQQAEKLFGKSFRWVKVRDRLGYHWDFTGHYAVSRGGDLVSFKKGAPVIIGAGNVCAILYIEGEALSTSKMQMVHQTYSNLRRKCVLRRREPLKNPPTTSRILK